MENESSADHISRREMLAGTAIAVVWQQLWPMRSIMQQESGFVIILLPLIN